VTAPQHRGLSAERWLQYPFSTQVLMIANEMNRASALLAGSALPQARGCYERVLQLTDLTVAAAATSARRRELLRWRDLVAAEFISPSPDLDAHRRAFRALLLMTPESAKQVSLLL
jgi:hypothetical protein